MYRRFGRASEFPLVPLQHFRGNLDNWDPVAATGPKGGPAMHGWREDIAAAARGQSKPDNLLYIMFAHTDTSQAKGMEFLNRFLERREGRDTPVSDAARDAQYDASS